MLFVRFGAMSAPAGALPRNRRETGWSRDCDSRMLEGETFEHITGRLWQMPRAESQRAMGHEGGVA